MFVHKYTFQLQLNFFFLTISTKRLATIITLDFLKEE